jgi:hypothetical protein
MVMEDLVAPFIADGRLVHYPNRRHPSSPAFAALLEELRANSQNILENE